MTTWAVILAGGVGSRFWPLSTARRPKQLLPLVTSRPLLLDTIDRMAPLADAGHTLILTSASLAPVMREIIPRIPGENVIVEPRPAGTAAALTWAASEIARRDGDRAVMMSVHADWAVLEAEGFRSALRDAAEIAESRHCLVTVGIVPSRVDPGLGYIRPGAPDVAGTSARPVAEFVEKPERDRAQRMIEEGCLWNSGIFVWRVGDFLAEVRAHCIEVAPALAECGADPRCFFAKARSVSVDVGVLERSNRVLVIPGRFGWDDVGTWAALHRVRPHDAQGNAVSGRVHAVDAAGNVVHAEDGEVVLYGVNNLVVVIRGGLTLVTTKERSAELKELLDVLPAELKERE